MLWMTMTSWKKAANRSFEQPLLADWCKHKDHDLFARTILQIVRRVSLNPEEWQPCNGLPSSRLEDDIGSGTKNDILRSQWLQPRLLLSPPVRLNRNAVNPFLPVYERMLNRWHSYWRTRPSLEALWRTEIRFWTVRLVQLSCKKYISKGYWFVFVWHTHEETFGTNAINLTRCTLWTFCCKQTPQLCDSCVLVCSLSNAERT